MKWFIFVILVLSFTPRAEAQFLRRIFGGRQQVQFQQSCHQQPVYYQQPVYQQQYYQPTNYQVVAAVPLATVPVAIDVQSYLYSVNAAAFQSFRDYQASKASQPETAPVVVQPASVGVGLADLTGPAVLKARCASCHTSGKIPRFFDSSGNLLAGAPLQEMLERITTDDPAQRMPPKGQLPTREAMAVLNYAVSSITPAGQQVATSESSRPSNPFD